MHRSAKLAASVAAAILLSAFLLVQRPSSNSAARTATGTADSAATGRYIIIDAGGALPMLLDTKTGRSWYRALPKDEARVLWIPIVIANPDADLNYLPPPDVK